MFPTQVDFKENYAKGYGSTVSSHNQSPSSNIQQSNRLDIDLPPTSKVSQNKQIKQQNTQPLVIFHHIQETDYTLESHLRNIVKPKPENLEKIREEQMKKEMQSYLQNTRLESSLRDQTIKDSFFSKSQRQKRSEERSNRFQKTLIDIMRSQGSTCCSSTKNSIIGNRTLSTQTSQKNYENIKSIQSSNAYTNFKNDLVIVPDDQTTKVHLLQFDTITPKKKMFNEKVDYWDYEGFFDKFEFNQSSMKKSVQRSRLSPRDEQMNNTAYLDQKKIRNGSIQVQKQQQQNVLKLAKPTSNETKTLRQHIMHPKIDRILEKFNFNKASVAKRSNSINESTISNNINFNHLQQKMYERDQEQYEEQDRINRIRKKVHTLIRKENEVYSPHKIPEYREFKQDFYNLNYQNVKKVFKNFRDYQQTESDSFYNIKQKNSYFRVYTDGQQKLVDQYLDKSDSEERVFYQYDHDPYINNQMTYKIFDIVGNSYMKQIPPHPFQHKRRFEKNQQQLERELHKTQYIYQARRRKNSTLSNEQGLFNEPDSFRSYKETSRYEN